MIIFIIFCDFFMVKDLRKLGNISKISKLQGTIAECSVLFAKLTFFSVQVKSPEKQKSNFSGSALFHMKNRVCLKYFVNDCLWK